MFTFKRVQSVLFAAAVLGTLACFAVRFPVIGQDAGSSKAKLNVLQEERRDALKTRVELTQELHKTAKGAWEGVIAAREDLLNAELEMATSKAERIEVLKHKVTNAKRS